MSLIAYPAKLPIHSLMVKFQQQLQKYIFSFKYTQAMQFTENFKNKIQHSPISNVDEVIKILNRFHYEILFRKGNFEAALAVIASSATQYRFYQKSYHQLYLLTCKARCTYYLGKLEAALFYLEQFKECFDTLDIFNQYSIIPDYIDYVEIQMKVLIKKSDLYEALHVVEEAEERYFLSKVWKHKHWLLNVHYLKGFTYKVQGELNKSLYHYKKALRINKIIKDFRLKGFILNNIGIIYKDKGLFDRALTHYRHCLALWTKVVNETEVARIKANIGWLFILLREFSKALVYLTEALEYYEKINNYVESYWVYFQIFHLFQQLKDSIHSKKYLLKLEQLYKEYPHIEITIYYKLALAIDLKNGHRLREIVQAQTLLEELGTFEDIDALSKILILQNLIETYLQEYQLLETTEVYELIMQSINKLYLIAESQSSIDLFANVSLLKSKLAILEGDFPKAQELLKKTYTTVIANAHENKSLMFKIQNEIDFISLQANNWKASTFSKLSISNKLDSLHINLFVQGLVAKQLSTNEINDYIQELKNKETLRSNQENALKLSS